MLMRTAATCLPFREEVPIVCVLGDVRVRTGASITSITSPAHRRLLARLAVADGSTVSVEQLIDTIWGDEPPARPKESLQSQIHRLRSLLGPGLLDSTPAGYRLNIARARTDLSRLTELARDAVAESEHAAFLAWFDASGDVLTGEALLGLSDEPWAIPIVSRVAEERAVVAERRVRSLIALGRKSDAIVAAERLAAVDPWRESSATVLIEALAQVGRVPEALRVSAAFRERHIERSGLSPSAHFADVVQRIVTADAGAERASPTLPVYTTGCIGRTEEIAELVALLAEERIVTVWGPGGIGKTRLAVAVAERLVNEFVVVFADLSETAEDERVIQVIGAASGAAGDASVEAVTRCLDGRQTLLLLDTAEHVVAPVARIVRRLVTRCPHLRLLITSRERLELPGEVTFEVAPLGSAGVALFAQRAAAARRGFRLDAVLTPIVASICDRLDGLPLAIELAAAQVGWRSPNSILAALAAPLDALDGPDSEDVRRTRLGATIDWSWGLLRADEQALLGRFAAFAAPFPLDAAQAVIDGDDSAVAHRLAELVRKSMVSVVDTDAPEMRYRLLDTVRAFVHRRTAAAGDDVAALSAVVRWAEQQLVEILAHTRSGDEDVAAVLRRKHRANIVGALDSAIRQGMTDEVMRCMPAIAEIGWLAVIRSTERVSALHGWEEHPAAAYLCLLRCMELHDVDRVRKAADIVESAGLPPHLCARARSSAVQAARYLGVDSTDDLDRLRCIAAADSDPRTAWARAYGECWAHPVGSPEVRTWSLRGAQIARAARRPALATISEYMAMQVRIGPEHADEYRRLYAEFARFGMGFYMELCRSVLDYADLGSRSVDGWLAQTRGAVAASPGLVRQFGEHRAHLLAHHGATRAAATIFGGLDRLRADGLDVSEYESGTMRERVVDENPEAYAQGQALGQAELSEAVVDHLEALSRLQGSAR